MTRKIARRSFLRASVASTTVLGSAGGDLVMTRPAEAGQDELLRVHFLLFDGAEALDYIAPYEVLRHARHTGALVATRLVSADRPRRGTSPSKIIELGLLTRLAASARPNPSWPPNAARPGWSSNASIYSRT